MSAQLQLATQYTVVMMMMMMMMMMILMTDCWLIDIVTNVYPLHSLQPRMLSKPPKLSAKSKYNLQSINPFRSSTCILSVGLVCVGVCLFCCTRLGYSIGFWVRDISLDA